MIAEIVIVEQRTALSITFGECVETHAGMEQIGNILPQGFTVEELEAIAAKFPQRSQITYLHKVLPEEEQEGNEAAVLVLRNGLELFEVTIKDLYREMIDLDHDKHAYMRGRVVNKLARYNLCFADISQAPDYENKKGRIYNFADLPLLQKIRNQMNNFFGTKTNQLNAELNVYYDMNKCGIGFHGDTERRVVVCIRLGETNPLEYQWFHQCNSVYDRIRVDLEEGDIYIMSDKAVGFDWKKRSKLTLRHAAGAAKYRTTKR